MEPNQTDHLKIELDDISIVYLKEIAKWGKFLSIVGFVVTGLIVILALFAGTIFATLSNLTPGGSSLPGGFSVLITIVYLALAVLYFFPCYFLYKFSSKAKQAIDSGEKEILYESFSNLKACFRFIGIMTIILLSIYALFFLIAIVAGGIGAFNN